MKKILTVQVIFILVLTFLFSSCSENKKPVTPVETVNTKENTEETNDIAYSTYSICLENTKSGPDAKDCCDCLDTNDLSVRKACRDATVSYDFSKNSTFKTFEIPSVLGKDGDYSSYTISGNQQECKQICEAIDTTLVCGDFQYCRTACDKLSQ